MDFNIESGCDGFYLFHGFLFIFGFTWSWFFPDFFLRLYGAGYTPARDNPQIVHRVMEIRKNQSAVKAHINSHKNKISEEQIRRIWLSVIDFEHGERAQ